ncbi:BON domain-containing protein [Pseudomonas sp. GOM7]|uniref:BON domain-containing protein n=1 Tax=unclassified Pseudomonas TaxID=196821 RepID=UPI00227AEE11|nr:MULTISPECIES: BON domain-containing protein [unclassified Pseudomonas]WAJ36702.1 BON domain-containing protein [Pseudomonas sp. GOM7]
MKRSAVILATLAVVLTLAGCGSRSIGNKIDDQFLGPDVATSISNANPDLSSPTSRIVVTAYNGVILLAGQTPRAELKDLAAQRARSVQGVKKVYNELQVQQPASLLARSNDSLLTTRIKAQMLTDSSVPSADIKVITENGIVYLMGVVNRAEANAATNVVQGVSGVQKVVRLFEYTN